jgi:hypothetical protein
MPYEASFTKRVEGADRDQYFNDCCVGGDIVVNQLLPAVRARYADIQTEQEDWGWFIWFRQGDVRLAIDVFTDDPDAGKFRIHLTSRTRRWGLFDRVVDTPELDGLRTLVASELATWVGGPVKITHIDRD